MRVRSWLAACAAATVCAWAGQAGATVYTLTVTGTVSSQTDTIGALSFDPIDRDGVFGPSGANLAGDAYTAVFTIDDTLGNEASSGPQIFRTGGAYYGVSDPILSAQVTINGQTMTVAPGWEDEILYDLSYPVSDPSKLTLQAIAQVWDQSGQEITAGQDSFNTVSDGGGTQMLLSDGSATISPDIAAVPVTPSDPGPSVPEPATWAVLLVGLFLLGTGLRLRPQAAQLH